ncbi:MAG TPA: hypothetical protein VFB21_01240 [Chthonomonadaceae bacterium]|nr:hypothetical protein [Chthonomonadaceae bacterium]
MEEKFCKIPSLWNDSKRILRRFPMILSVVMIVIAIACIFGAVKMVNDNF